MQTRAGKKAPFLSNKKIEVFALNTIDDYGKRFGAITEPPIPVDEIVDCLLDVCFEMKDLAAVFQAPDVLGATWFGDRIIAVDRSLGPVEFPDKEGRYRFTVAHEIGHWELHGALFNVNSNQQTMFGADSELIICRAFPKARKPPIEWQADAFAAGLLMPKDMVISKWEEINGSLSPYIAKDELRFLRSEHGLGENDTPTVDIAWEMARIFKVSGQAMQIRLRQLHLIKFRDMGPTLF